MRAGALSCLPWAWPDFLPSMSMLPLKLAPSMMLTAGAKILPRTFAGLLHEDGFVGMQIALHRALDDDQLRADVRLDGALRADGQTLRMR